GGWLSPRLICASAILPMLIIAGQRIYPLAWLIFSMGIGSCLVPALERHPGGSRRWMIARFAGLVGVVLTLAGWVFGGDWLKQWREAGRPVPPAGSPNVLVIVLDTVRADHLSLYGYERPTSPTLERLAQRGICFQEARATAPWTLPSHASLFTGRWPHELAVQWATPLGGTFPTLAGYLGQHGYATAGFVANTLYCSYDTGLDRGFTHYEDYVLQHLSPFRTARLVDLSLKTVADLCVALSLSLDMGVFRPWQESLLASLLTRLEAHDRKDAGSINREFLGWLSRRERSGRPFFAFLNYYDAHSLYLLPPGAVYRFGLKPRTQADFQ